MLEIGEGNTMKRSQQDEQENDTLRAMHRTLKNALSDAETARGFMTHICAQPAVAQILDAFRSEAGQQHEDLVKAEKKDVEKMQAFILASRGLLNRFEDAYKQEVIDSIDRLKEFESKNALFIQAQARQQDEKDGGAIAGT